MIRQLALLLVLVCASPAFATVERRISFGEYPVGQTPAGFRSAASVTGNPGEWKIILDEAPTAFEPLSPQAPRPKRHVLAQLAEDTTDEHYPILIFDEERYGDFTLTTRFKNVSGKVAQMAGIAFRVQDENNYYIVRASSLGNTFRFYKFVNGERSPAIGPNIEIPAGVWHKLTVECRGNQIRCFLNGEEVIPPLTDNSFTVGRIGFWTKSDAVSYFADTVITYTPREILAQRLINQVLERQRRLVGLRIYALNESDPTRTQVIASDDEEEIGNPGSRTELDVIRNGTPYYTRGRTSVTVTMPVQDRNGDPVAAVAVELRRLPGQTEQNALARATPIVRQISSRVLDREDLWR